MADEPRKSLSLEERVGVLETKLKEIENRLSAPTTPQQPAQGLEHLDPRTASVTSKIKVLRFL